MPGTMLSPRRIPLARLGRRRHLVSMESAGRGEGIEHASPVSCSHSPQCVHRQVIQQGDALGGLVLSDAMVPFA